MFYNIYLYNYQSRKRVCKCYIEGKLGTTPHLPYYPLHSCYLFHIFVEVVIQWDLYYPVIIIIVINNN